MKYDIITDYDSIDINKWTGFVNNHPLGNAFLTPEMFRIYKSAKYYEPVVVVCVDEFKEFHGLIVSVIQREFGGLLGKLSSRSIIWGAPLIKNDNPEILGILLDSYDKIVGKKVVYTQIRNLWDTEGLKSEFGNKGYIYEEHLNILIDLTKSEDTLWKEVYSRRRSQINKSERQGISVKIFNEPDLVDESYSILLDVYDRAKLPLPGREFFKEANTILGEKGYLKLFGAFYKERLIGVMYLLCFKGRTYEWYIGSYIEYMRMHPNDLIIWEIIKWGKENGYNIFDFGGAGRPDKEYGVREYKKKFGGSTLNLGRYQKTHNKLLMNISVLGFKMWQLFKFSFRKK